MWTSTCEAWRQNVIFRDTSRSIAWSRGMGALDCQESAGYGRREEEEGGNYPSWERGQMLQWHICVLVFAAARTPQLVGIQYNWFLKCAFLQLFLKLLWQGFTSSWVWLSPQGWCAEAKLGSQFGKLEKKKLCSFQMFKATSSSIIFWPEGLCSLHNGTTAGGLEVSFSQKDDAQCCFFGAAVAVCPNKNSQLGQVGVGNSWDSNSSSLSL